MSFDLSTITYRFLDEKIYEWLAGDTTDVSATHPCLHTLLGASDTDPRIYPSRPKKDAVFPCLSYRVGPGHTEEMCGAAEQTTVNVDVWSDQDDPLECLALARRVKEVLYDERYFAEEDKLTLYRLKCEFESGPIFEPESRVYHNALRFRANLEYG